MVLMYIDSAVYSHLLCILRHDRGESCLFKHILALILREIAISDLVSLAPDALRILTDEDYEGTEEEMARREVIKYMAIEKLASALTAHHTDPEKIFNYGLRTKSGLKVNKFINYKYAIEELWKKFGRQGMSCAIK